MRSRSPLTGQYLLCDGASTFDELSLGEAVRGGDLQGSGLLDEEDASVAELLHSRFNLETNLEEREHQRMKSYRDIILIRENWSNTHNTPVYIHVFADSWTISGDW